MASENPQGHPLSSASTPDPGNRQKRGKAPRQIFGRLHGNPFAFHRFRPGQAVRIYTNGVWAKGYVVQATDRALQVRAPRLGAGDHSLWWIYDARNAIDGHSTKGVA